MYDTDYVYKQDYNSVIYESQVQKILLENELKKTNIELRQAKDKLKNIKERILESGSVSREPEHTSKKVISIIKHSSHDPLQEITTYFYVELVNTMKMIEKEYSEFKDETNDKNKRYVYAKAGIEINKNTDINC